MKRIVAIMIAIILAVLPAADVFADSTEKALLNTEDSFENYDKYTLIIGNSDNTKDLANRFGDSIEVTVVSSIEEGIVYVQKMDLQRADSDFLKQSWLDELTFYKENNVDLLDYTMLVPKSTRSETVYGTYNGHTFYYENSAYGSTTVQ